MNLEENNNDSLEGGGTVVGSSDSTAKIQPDKQTKSFGDHIRNIISKVNIYFLLFIFVVTIAIVIVLISSNSAKQSNKAKTDAKGQTLNQDSLNDLKGSETKVGDPKQTLGIESNTIFSGKVLVRDSLEVAGQIKVGGSLSLPGISVSGSSSFDQVTINNLAISGNTSIQGTLLVQKNLTVTGSASFGGSLSAATANIDSLILAKDLQLNRHIDAGGGTPKVSNGGGIGNGGTVSINGTDTAGTITINTGTSVVAGVLANVTFTNQFSQTPHVVITPVGGGGANLGMYINRTTSGFTLVSTAPAPNAVTFSIDFIAID